MRSFRHAHCGGAGSSHRWHASMRTLRSVHCQEAERTAFSVSEATVDAEKDMCFVAPWECACLRMCGWS